LNLSGVRLQIAREPLDLTTRSLLGGGQVSGREIPSMSLKTGWD
jgi:hypothetical protein